MRGGITPISRRGTAYLMVLVGATIITVIGLSAMAALRAQRSVVSSEEDLTRARLLARAALERGVQMISDDGAWRTSLGAGWWFTDTPVGTRGAISLQVTDPDDGNITDDPRDVVLLSAIGASGSARSLVRMRMYATAGLGSLESAMHTGNTFKLDASTLRTDQRISANSHVEGSNSSNYYTDVEAGGDVKGATYHGGKKARVQPRAMPDNNTIVSTYALRGTVIAYTDLRDGGPNLTQNPSMEDGINGWFAYGGGTVGVVTGAGQAWTGAAGLSSTGRTQNWHGPAQIVTSSVQSGRKYRVEARVRGAAGAVAGVRISLRIDYRDDGDNEVKWYRTTGTAVNGWTQLDGLFDISWSGSLQQATLYVDTDASTSDLIIDDFRIYADGNNGPRRLREVLLSPESNPYGSGATNSEGVYIINCAGKQIIIEDCRIVGTLVLISPHSSSIVRGSVNWAAAAPNFPVLITGDDMTFDLSPAPVAEVDWGVSLNPAATPFPYAGGAGNTTLNDAFPSEIKGLIFGAKKLYPVRGTFAGVMMALDDIELKNANVRMSYDPIYMNSPPPGFDAVQRIISIEDGSYGRWTD